MCLDHHRVVHTIDESNKLMNSAMAQPRSEAMAARGGLSHLLDNFRLGNGLGRLAYPLSGPPRSHLSRVDSSYLLEFMSFTIAPLWTSLSWRYL